jgi:hypothetical protein
MPLIGDYDDAIRAGKVRFKDAALKAAAPVMAQRAIKGGSIEEPVRAAGSYAVAYKMKLADGRLRAVRCYFSENAQHSQRYRLLHSELPAKLKEYTVDFRYLDHAIRAENTATAPYLPVVDMEWVQGRELRQYVAHIADNRDITRITALAEAWLTMMQRMRVAQVAHGDLSGNNIMVRDNGALVLIDYDGMYTPALANDKSNEAGAPEYQHPTAQDRRQYGPEMDRFSALLIYVVLRALQEQPGLWKSHAEYSGTGTTNLVSDRMLFKAEDLKAPTTSALFRELAALKDPLTLKLVAALKQACVDDITRTPWVVDLADPMIAFKAAIASDNDQAIVTAAADPGIQALAAARSYDARVSAAKRNLAALTTLQQALREGDDEKIAAAWKGMTETATTRPFKAQADAAAKRATQSEQLREAIKTLDYPAIKRIEEQLRGTKTLEPYTRAIRETYVRYERLEAIKRALDLGNDDVAVRVWDLAAQDTQPPAFKQRLAPFEERVRQARERGVKIRAAREAVTGRDDLALAGLWPDISASPSVQDLAEAARQARERVAAIPKLRQALDDDNLSEAQRIWEQYHLQGRPIAQPYEQRYREARAGWVKRLDPRDVSVTFRGTSLFIRWEWPENVTTVIVAVDTAGFPASPRANDSRCTRDEYQKQGSGFLVTPPPAKRYYVRLFSLVLQDGLWTASLGQSPGASVTIEQPASSLEYNPESA